jgi:hypothetical protein
MKTKKKQLKGILTAEEVSMLTVGRYGLLKYVECDSHK